MRATGHNLTIFRDRGTDCEVVIGGTYSGGSDTRHQSILERQVEAAVHAAGIAELEGDLFDLEGFECVGSR